MAQGQYQVGSVGSDLVSFCQVSSGSECCLVAVVTVLAKFSNKHKDAFYKYGNMHETVLHSDYVVQAGLAACCATGDCDFCLHCVA